jgi:hypothetical protein
MRISGHKTRSVFDRYNVTSERDLIDAAQKIEPASLNYSKARVAKSDEETKAGENVILQ